MYILYHFDWFGLGCDLWCRGRNFAYGQIAEDLWHWKKFGHVTFASLPEEPQTRAKMWSNFLTAKRSTKCTWPDDLWHGTGDGIQPKPLALWHMMAESIEMVQYSWLRKLILSLQVLSLPVLLQTLMCSGSLKCTFENCAFCGHLSTEHNGQNYEWPCSKAAISQKSDLSLFVILMSAWWYE